MVGFAWPAEVAQEARSRALDAGRTWSGAKVGATSIKDLISVLAAARTIHRSLLYKDPHNDPCSNKGFEDQRPCEDERPRHSSDYVTSEDPLPNTEGRQPGPQDECRSNQRYNYIYTK
ncbi:hypothetical protein ACLKA7_005205 [Drosophila subpalustris]